jgi:hypothetical protein
MRGSPPRLSRVGLTALLALFVAVGAWAQVQTGNIFGRVLTRDGAPVPGATVTLSGIGAPQTFVTDAQGNFRFLNLSPGNYQLKAELAGMGSAVRTGIGVNIGRSSDVSLMMSPSVEQAITVTAEAPVLDVRKTGTGSNVTRVELEKIPTARDPWVILQQTPGVIMDRNNVGGNESGQQSVYVSKGTTGTQSTWNVDGVNITDFGATGSSPTYYDFDVFEEMQITTGGTDPRIQTPGVQLNMVTKRGTNDFRGSARMMRASRDWQADPEIPEEAAGYLARVNEINETEELGAEIGGPIIRDRLWFWGAYGEQNIDILTATLLSGSRFRDKTELENHNVKFNAQILPSNHLTVVDQFGAKIKLGRNVGVTRPPETAWNQNNAYENGTGGLTDPTLWKIEDTQIIGSNLYLTGLYSEVQGGFQLIADNGNGCQSFDCGVDALPAYRDSAGDNAWHRTYLSYESIRPQTQYRLDGSAFFSTGDLNHELKFGWGYREASVTSSTAWPGSQYSYNYGAGFNPDTPASTGYVAFMRIPTFTYESQATDFYVGDTLLLNNLTIQAGLRWDIQKGATSQGVGQPNPNIPDILPGYSFGEVSGLEWSDISPRVGLTYTMGADRRTLLRASYSRYVNQLNSGAVLAVSPGSAAYIYYYFNDVNSDHIAQRNEIDFNYGPFFWRGFDPDNPTAFTQRTRWYNDLGAPYTDEIILGGEREILNGFSVGLNATYRKLDNFIQTIGEKTQGGNDFYSPADYVLQAPVTATLPNGETREIEYYNLRPGVSVPRFFVIRNQPDYTQTYKGLELNATKRMANRWMLRGNVTLQDWTQDAGQGGIADPSRLRTLTGTGCDTCSGTQVITRSAGSGNKGNVWINSKWAYNLTGVYQIPVIETSFGFNLNGRQGYPLPYVWLVRGGTGEGNKSILVTDDTDEFRNDDVTTLDLRLAKDVRFGGVGVTLSVDAFNVLNQNTILQRNVGQLNASAGSPNLSSTNNRIVEVLSPRIFKVGARLSF